MRERYEGSCHCGRVRFRVSANLARVVDCNCSMCTKKGFVHAIVPLADFDVRRLLQMRDPLYAAPETVFGDQRQNMLDC